MRISLSLLMICCAVNAVLGQMRSSIVDVVTTYSQNGTFYLKSIPSDGEYPTLRGRTAVYEQGKAEPVYVFDRGFDSVTADSNNLVLSNDGETIFFALTWGANENKEGLKTVTVYRHGRIFKSFTEQDITGCDKKKERCSFLYSNYDEVVYSSPLPQVFEMWNLGDEYFLFRKTNNDLARREKQQELIRKRQEYEKRLTLDHMNGLYIPKDLGECLSELDRLLAEVDKKEMLALPQRESMIRYHMGLGLWMRNNWGLWGGSRLQKYFLDRGVNHPDGMSGVVLFHYYDWLHGNKERWKDWERNPKGRGRSN